MWRITLRVLSQDCNSSMSERNRMMYSLLQTKERQHLILFSNEKVGFYSNELESVGEHENSWCHSIVKSQWNWHFGMKKELNHLNVCHGSGNLRVCVNFWSCQLQQMNPKFKKPPLMPNCFWNKKLEKNTYDDEDFKRDHLNSIDDLIAFGLQ